MIQQTTVIDTKLCLDLGNTRIKAAVFEGACMVFNQVFDQLSPTELKQLVRQYSIKHCILSSVRNHPSYFNEVLHTYCTTFIELTHKTPIPIQNNYTTPKTLGKDRLAAVIGGVALYPNSHILVIDAGTCITFDFVDSEQTYHGGSISMGLNMRFRALHTFTDQLPLIEREDIGNLIGRNTRQSILSGVIGGTIAELNGLIEQYRSQYSPLTVLITGGDVLFFESKLKSEIFARPNLVLLGLNKILDYNVAKALE